MPLMNFGGNELRILGTPPRNSKDPKGINPTGKFGAGYQLLKHMAGKTVKDTWESLPDNIQHPIEETTKTLIQDIHTEAQYSPAHMLLGYGLNAAGWTADKVNKAGQYIGPKIGIDPVLTGDALEVGVGEAVGAATVAITRADKIRIVENIVDRTINVPIVGERIRNTLTPAQRITTSQSVGAARSTLRKKIYNPEHLEQLSGRAQKKYDIVQRLLSDESITPRTSKAILQTHIDSPLFTELLDKNLTNKQIDRVTENYFKRRSEQGTGFGINVQSDHLTSISSASEVLSRSQNPVIIEKALDMQRAKGRLLGHDGELSVVPYFTHKSKHHLPDGIQTWDDSKTWAKSIIDELPANATAEQISGALDELYTLSLLKTGAAYNSKSFFEFREAVLESLGPKIRKRFGDDFDITGRTNAGTPEWKEFSAYMRERPTAVKSILRKLSNNTDSIKLENNRAILNQMNLGTPE